MVCYSDQLLLTVNILLTTSLCYSLALIVYYAVTDVVITTIAHICAIILGFVLGYAFCRCAGFTARLASTDEHLESKPLQVDLRQ
jgi:hypothetical protein